MKNKGIYTKHYRDMALKTRKKNNSWRKAKSYKAYLKAREKWKREHDYYARTAVDYEPRIYKVVMP